MYIDVFQVREKACSNRSQAGSEISRSKVAKSLLLNKSADLLRPALG